MTKLVVGNYNYPWGIRPGDPRWIAARRLWSKMHRSDEWVVALQYKDKAARARVIEQWRMKL